MRQVVSLDRGFASRLFDAVNNTTGDAHHILVVAQQEKLLSADEGDMKYMERVKKALAALEKSIARRRVRENFDAVIQAAKKRFLDDGAVAAGAEAGKFCTSARTRT
jgi:hypothetical protein